MGKEMKTFSFTANVKRAHVDVTYNECFYLGWDFPLPEKVSCIKNICQFTMIKKDFHKGFQLPSVQIVSLLKKAKEIES